MGRKSRNKRSDRPEVVSPEGLTTPGGATTPADVPRGTLVALSVALFLITLVIFSGVRRDQFLDYDDNEYITLNEHVSTGLNGANVQWGLTALHAANWHPLTWWSHMADVEMFGMNAGRHALVNVVLHGLNSVLLMLLLVRVTRRLWPSAMVGALFALHPTHVESVAWVAERKDVLSTLFFLLAIALYFFWREKPSIARYVGVVVAFALGLMAKPMVITLPFVLLLLDAWPLQRWSLADRSKLIPLIVEKLPLFALIIPSALLTMKAQTTAMSPWPLSLRIANAAQSYVAYIGNLLLPIDLSVIYPFRSQLSVVNFLASLIVLIGITVTVIMAGRRRPYLPVGWLWYLGTLVPVIGFVHVGRQAMADRYAYIPSIGLFIAAVWWLSDTPALRAFLKPLAAVVLIACAALTWNQVGYWRDSETLFRHALKVTKNNAPAHIALGRVLLEKPAPDLALEEFKQAVALMPDDEEALEGLGLSQAGVGDLQAASETFRKVITINPQKSHHYQVAGRIALALGKDKEAIDLFERGIAVKDEPVMRALLATARGDVQGAVTNFGKAVDLEPKSAELRNDYGALLVRAGRYPDGITQYEEALRLRPGQYEAHTNLASLLNKIGRTPEAIKHYEEAASLRTSSPEPHIYIALAHASQKQWAKAIQSVQAAMAIDPVQSNAIFTEAAHLPPNPGNLQQYLGTLKANEVTQAP
jgi:tetratricopeptide (TPR) repeat protein